jgi:gluconolactonase
MSSPTAARLSFKVSDFRVVARGLNYPEGPVYCKDTGTVLVVEIGARILSRIYPDGSKPKEVVATLGGGPNGAAHGPDGAVYVCNDGGFFIAQVPRTLPDGRKDTIQVAVGEPPNGGGGSIQRVAPDGTFSTLYSTFPAKDPFDPKGIVQMLPLRSPDDLVFDEAGGFWFTDWGKDRWRDRDITGVYYAKPDGSSIEEKIFPLKSPNGIGLSPDNKRLYVAESFTRRILYWDLSAPGVIQRNPKTQDGSYLLTAKLPFEACLDSLALDEAGNIYVACFLPHGADPMSRGGIAVVAPDGEWLEWIEIDIGDPDPLPSNLCFGGPDRRTAYITLDATGLLIACEMRIPGKELLWAK